MKCKHCGGNLSLEDAFCLHCGHLNEDVRQYVAEMERYQDNFEDTREDVYTVTRKFSGITARAVIIAILTVLCLVFFLMSENWWSIRRSMIQAESKVQAQSYKEQMIQYLENEEYQDFVAFCNLHYIHYYEDDYAEYGPVMQAASYYEYTSNAIMNLTTSTSQDMMNTYISDLVEYYCFCEKAEKMDEYQADTKLGDLSRKSIAQMDANIKAMLRAYLGFTEEEAEDFLGMRKSEKMLILEQKCEEMGYGKTNE
ncbi:MAG: hypothetical protein MR646_05530 [Agathobacter sp.]|nr:hypothetical protein [Agathobacter sp.]